MDFQDTPYIGNPSDALDLLDQMIGEADPENELLLLRLEALKDALERSII
jgi:hypothetical protein